MVLPRRGGTGDTWAKVSARVLHFRFTSAPGTRSDCTRAGLDFSFRPKLRPSRPPVPTPIVRFRLNALTLNSYLDGRPRDRPGTLATERIFRPGSGGRSLAVLFFERATDRSRGDEPSIPRISSRYCPEKWGIPKDSLDDLCFKQRQCHPLGAWGGRGPQNNLLGNQNVVQQGETQ